MPFCGLGHVHGLGFGARPWISGVGCWVLGLSLRLGLGITLIVFFMSDNVTREWLGYR